MLKRVGKGLGGDVTTGRMRREEVSKGVGRRFVESVTKA